MQPPSGGCVLQLNRTLWTKTQLSAAAFGRLCVETLVTWYYKRVAAAAAFGRLCVETSSRNRLTVGAGGSRLRAAVC